MKVVILAGGFGTRLSEETDIKPKPMVEIGGKPIIWHLMKIYSFYGFNEFIICLGYKGYLIKEFFANYFLHTSDVTFDYSKKVLTTVVHSQHSEPWKVTLVDTGLNTMTGGRLRRVKNYIDNDKPFFMTYGDGLSNININTLLESHHISKKLATVTAVYPPGRFGSLLIRDNDVTEFTEKPLGDGGFINGGFFVLDPKVIDLIDSDNTVWEKEPISKLVIKNQLNAFIHDDFWQPMDTLREKNMLEDLWLNKKAPWNTWGY